MLSSNCSNARRHSATRSALQPTATMYCLSNSRCAARSFSEILWLKMTTSSRDKRPEPPRPQSSISAATSQLRTTSSATTPHLTSSSGSSCRSITPDLPVAWVSISLLSRSRSSSRSARHTSRNWGKPRVRSDLTALLTKLLTVSGLDTCLGMCCRYPLCLSTAAICWSSSEPEGEPNRHRYGSFSWNWRHSSISSYLQVSWSSWLRPCCFEIRWKSSICSTSCRSCTIRNKDLKRSTSSQVL
mmetsp:Transcript_66412/g.172753  ORF Transcript_66412/g.172753 Transcript_66412/m.172753 type:complete len:243 (+) Transcript_66412:563-1291(+)